MPSSPLQPPRACDLEAVVRRWNHSLREHSTA